MRLASIHRVNQTFQGEKICKDKVRGPSPDGGAELVLDKRDFEIYYNIVHLL